MAARLTIVHITDVYILDNFPHLKTLVQQVKAENPNTVSMLTGDFLAPYLLSSIDHGVGMMNMIMNTPIDYLTWGNHEADVPHEHVCKRVREFYDSGGTWINSNMQEHEMMAYQKPYDIIEVKSADGAHVRRIGLIAVLSDDKSLYKKFKSPGAFNGATIESPWKTLATYKKVLEDMNCDLIIPLQHLYEKEDVVTCEKFDFPLILSGHDHHKVDREVNGTRLLKPGLDAHYATVLDISWDDPASLSPAFSWKFVRVKDFDADASMLRAMQDAYSVLMRLRRTELAPVPASFRPLSSVLSRGRVTTMGKLVCSMVRNAVNGDGTRHDVDACIIRGGHICGEKDYPDGSFFSLEDLQTVNTDKVSIGIVDMPGDLLAAGVKSTRGSVSRLFIQYDDGVVEGEDGITHVGGEPLDPKKVYRVATTPTTIYDVAVFADHFRDHAIFEDDVVPLDVELMAHFARTLWLEILRSCDPNATGEVDTSMLDTDGDGMVSKAELQQAMQHLGTHVVEGEFTLVDCIISIADRDKDGQISVDEVRRSNLSRKSIRLGQPRS